MAELGPPVDDPCTKLGGETALALDLIRCIAGSHCRVAHRTSIERVTPSDKANLGLSKDETVIWIQRCSHSLWNRTQLLFGDLRPLDVSIALENEQTSSWPRWRSRSYQPSSLFGEAIDLDFQILTSPSEFWF
jgi:hypothetical protein